MHLLISHVWKRFLNYLFKHIILVLTLMLCIGVGVALSNMFTLSSHLIQSQAVQNAVLQTQSLTQAIDLYSDAAVARAETVNGITVTHAYLTKKGAIPVPSTFAIELGDKISEDNSDMSVRLYSDHPFPWRKAQGGPKDEFERLALSTLRQNPKQKFFRLEQRDGHTWLRYGEASIMQPSCVACHNTDPSSPKKNWEVGDVIGVWEINQSLDTLVNKIGHNLMGTFVMLGGISVLGLSGLSLVIAKLRQTAKELEQRVRLRTADLAQANMDLDQRNRLIRQVFGRYLSDNVVTNLLKNPEALKLGGERRKITILTSDLRGFSALSEQLSPEEVINILNIYLEYMADVIDKHQGTIDEFMGDGILVLFGAPLSTQDDALRALACACAMQLAMGSVNEKMKELGLARLEMGIGIHTGEVMVGNIGSHKRTKYGIVGSPVNLAYRIESYTRGGQILISEQTLQEAGSVVKIRGQKQVQPKGFTQPITVYDVYGVGGYYNLYLPKEEDVFFTLPEQIPIQYTILEGKQIKNNIFQGSLVKLSANGAEIVLESVKECVPPELANIKINLLTQNNLINIREDIYGKVWKQQTHRNSFCIHFTAIPLKAQLQIDTLYQSLAHQAACCEKNQQAAPKLLSFKA